VSAEGIHKGVTRQLRQVDVTDAGRRLIAFAQERPQKVESRT
jgi:hypothetical protein